MAADMADSQRSFLFFKRNSTNLRVREIVAYVDACKGVALYETGVSAAYGDKLITLSTCDDSGKNSRVVVVAKRITEPR